MSTGSFVQRCISNMILSCYLVKLKELLFLTALGCFEIMIPHLEESAQSLYGPNGEWPSRSQHVQSTRNL